MRLRIDGEWFVDEKERRVLLRGVNLSGSSKMPFRPDGATHLKTDFSDHRDVSFVGRPFPLEEAEQHLRRIKNWGFNSLRFLVTWEAIEHSGPGMYDTEYLDYVEEVLKIVDSEGLWVIIDPHQDVWSRMSGGDGAPGWTFESVGIDLTRFDATGAATLMQHRYDPENPKAYPAMSWSQNRICFAASTMWTLFFGGRDYAPSLKIDGMNSQNYFQNHYFGALEQVAARVRNIECVLGFDTLNEPDQGWIGRMVDGSNLSLDEVLGHAFTPIDAMLTAAGQPCEIPYREVKRLGIKETRRNLINPDRISVWIDEDHDIWRRECVWEVDEKDEPRILRNDHFMQKDGQSVDFYIDHLSPFFIRYAERIRRHFPDAMVFFEAPMETMLKGEVSELRVPSNSAHAPHWYDVATIGMKRFMGKASYDIQKESTVIGPGSIQKMFTRQLRSLKEFSKKTGDDIPTVLGEFGLCYDLDNKQAYKEVKTNPTGAWKTHVQALSMYYQALDDNLLHSMHWNYTPDNNNQWGDKWNLEDFSVFSPDQQDSLDDLNSGGRAIRGFCRPHFVEVAGVPLRMEFSPKHGEFLFEFDADTTIEGPTVIFAPRPQFPEGFEIESSQGTVDHVPNSQLVLVHSEVSGTHRIRLSRRNSSLFQLKEE